MTQPQRTLSPTSKSWVIALEIDEDPDGPNLDVKAVARRMDAVAGIHPSPRGGRRHSFLVRLDGNDPADALVAAVSRFREAPVRGGALLGARVVRAGGAEDQPPTRQGLLRPRVLAGVAGALLAGAALMALLPGSGGSGGATRTSTGSAASSGTGSAGGAGTPNLVVNGSFEQAAAKHKGLARHATAWGAAEVALVDAPVQSGKRAQRLAVGPGQMGGVWFEVSGIGSGAYEQSAWLQVLDLGPESRVEMIVEWYGADSNLLDYHALPLTTTDTGLVRRAQTTTAPPGASRARFLVNFTRGGSLVIDDAELRPAPAPTPATTSGGAPH